MKLIQQTNPWNCGSACLAMVTGRDIKHIEDFYKRDPSKEIEGLAEYNDGFNNLGWASYELAYVLWDLNFKSFQFYLRESILKTEAEAFQCMKFAAQNGSLLMDENEFVNYVYDPKYATIAGIQSKKDPKKGHWVVIHEQQVFDPLEPETYDCNSDNVQISGESVLVEL